ncbi:MAG: hypothetical protein MJ201_01320 [Mycoplasmoidaceae bacterium]|nr:hypothetical protein [Mycoplasmoidaceae bacterium]
MKKLVLIPTALIAGLTPVISLVGCNKSVIDYTVTDQEMQDALLLKGVNYFQQNRSAETTTELVDIGVRTTVQAEADINFAPTVYYNYTQQNFSEPEIITA